MLEPDAGPTRMSGSQRGVGQQWPAPTRLSTATRSRQLADRTKHAADGHTALLSQGVLAAFISEGLVCASGSKCAGRHVAPTFLRR
jgi:hypothetical protein